MPSELKACVEQNGIENAIHSVIFQEVSLANVTEMAYIIAIQMLKKKWRFYIPAKELTFITSDNPVSFGSGNGLDFYGGPALAEITVPLRKDLALVVSPYQEGNETITEKDQFSCRTATIQQTAIINKRTAASALRYIYSSENSSAILELVQSVKGTCQKIIAGYYGDKRAEVVDNPYCEG